MMGKTISEPSRETPVLDTCEVLVAGGGIAGIAAALSAARCGKRVLLAEREYGLGGLATLGLVTIYLPLCDGCGHQLIYGIGEELLRLSIEHGAEDRYPDAWLDPLSGTDRARQRYQVQYNPHLFALRAERLLLESGVSILYGTHLCGVRTEGGRITHVIAENKSGRSAIAADTVIDATGDADICALCGAPTALHEGGNAPAGWYYEQREGKPRLKMFGFAEAVPERGQKAVYSGARVSGVDGRELSQGICEVHGRMYGEMMKNLSEDPERLPVTMSSIPQLRMTRRLAGAATPDDDAVFADCADSVGLFGDWRKCGPAYALPFGSLYCREVANLLAAGRNISVTDRMWDITRVIPCCAVSGEAAGAAAAVSSDFVRADIGSIQKILRGRGVRLEMREVYPKWGNETDRT